MEIVNANIVGYYSYKSDIEIINYGVKEETTKDCAICKGSLYEPSYDTVSNNSNIIKNSEITVGKCGHFFHGDCLNNWLKSNTDCPIDKVKWHLHHIVDTTTKLALYNKKQYCQEIKRR